MPSSFVLSQAIKCDSKPSGSRSRRALPKVRLHSIVSFRLLAC
jgi:hypothetical protein